MAITILCNIFETAFRMCFAILNAMNAFNQNCFEREDGIEYARNNGMKISLQSGSDI